MASSSSSWWIIGGLSCARSRADDGRRLFRVDPFFVEADGTDLRRRPRRRFAPAAAPVCGRGIVPIARWARAQPQAWQDLAVAARRRPERSPRADCSTGFVSAVLPGFTSSLDEILEE